MAERPILFNTQMVKAILDGRKTQTRRIIKPQPKRVDALYPDGSLDTNLIFKNGDPRIKCPFGVVGDRLWVRETWATAVSLDNVKPSNLLAGYPCEYKAGGTSINGYENLVSRGKWRPSIHMPHCASRITLEVSGLSVEQLRDITVSDAINEGIQNAIPTMDIDKDNGLIWFDGRHIPSWAKRCDNAASPIDAFADLWDQVYKECGCCWSENPWVWVIEFKRIKK